MQGGILGGCEAAKKLGVAAGTKFYRGKGCTQCKGGGYDRRIAIFELLPVDEAMRSLILKKASSADIKVQAIRSGMVPMRVDGIRKAQAGLTTVEEVLKVTLEGE